MNGPSPAEPLLLTCPVCGGRGKDCRHCRDGRFEVDGCPMRIVPDDVWSVVEMAELYEKGLPPVSGGVLDQANGFIEACRFVWNEANRHKAELDMTE